MKTQAKRGLAQRRKACIQLAQHAQNDRVMGYVGRSIVYTEAASDERKVSVMTGKWELKPEVLSAEGQSLIAKTGYGKIYAATLLGAKKLAENIRGDEAIRPDDTLPVIVKRVAEGDGAIKEDIRNLSKEVAALKELRHPNVLLLYGCITHFEEDGVSMSMVFEHPGQGNLKRFLDSRRLSGGPQSLIYDVGPESDGATVSSEAKVSMAHDIATGMAYLIDKHDAVFHEMAAHICILSEDGVVRIGDWGQARTDFPAAYSPLSGAPKQLSFPVRWMAPETLKEFIEWNKLAAVWSFAVTVWEIAMLGAEPYEGLSNAEVQPYVIAGSHPSLTKFDMPEAVSDLVQMCFSADPASRPDFGTIAETLAAVMVQRGKAPRASQILADTANDDLYAMAPVASVSASYPASDELYEVPMEQRDTTATKEMVLDHDQKKEATMATEDRAEEKDVDMLSNDTYAAADSNACQSGTMVMPSSSNTGEKFSLPSFMTDPSFGGGGSKSSTAPGRTSMVSQDSNVYGEVTVGTLGPPPKRTPPAVGGAALVPPMSPPRTRAEPGAPPVVPERTAYEYQESQPGSRQASGAAGDVLADTYAEPVAFNAGGEDVYETPAAFDPASYDQGEQGQDVYEVPVVSPPPADPGPRMAQPVEESTYEIPETFSPAGAEPTYYMGEEGPGGNDTYEMPAMQRESATYEMPETFQSNGSYDANNLPGTNTTGQIYEGADGPATLPGMQYDAQNLEYEAERRKRMQQRQAGTMTNEPATLLPGQQPVDLFDVAVPKLAVNRGTEEPAGTMTDEIEDVDLADALAGLGALYKTDEPEPAKKTVAVALEAKVEEIAGMPDGVDDVEGPVDKLGEYKNKLRQQPKYYKTSRFKAAPPAAKLRSACKKGYYELVGEILLDPQLEIDGARTGGSGKVALHHAADKGFVKIVTMLLDRGANPYVVDSFGMFALDYASKAGRQKVIKVIKRVMLQGGAQALGEVYVDEEAEEEQKKAEEEQKNAETEAVAGEPKGESD